MGHQSITATASITTVDHHDHPKIKKKRKRGAMHLIRVAVYMLTHKSSKSKTTHAAAATSSNWKKLLGSIRPFHVHSNQSPPRVNGAPEIPVLTESVDDQLQVFTPPFSPAQASVASSSDDRSSRYASANNLQELDKCDEDGIEYDDDNDGDDMVDIRAEQFIAEFYRQMRLQREAYDGSDY